MESKPANFGISKSGSHDFSLGISDFGSVLITYYKDEGRSEDEDEGPQQEVNVAPVVMVERAGGSPRPANGPQSLPNLVQYCTISREIAERHALQYAY